MVVGYVIKEANPEYFYFVSDPEKINNLSVGGIVKIYINNIPYFALIEDLVSVAVEEERLFDYEAIKYIYGEIKKPQYLLTGKAIFIGCIKDNKVLSEKPQVPPIPGQEVYLPTEEEIEKLYSFEDKKITISIGYIKLSEKNYEIQAKIKELIIRHTGIFGITGSGKSTTVAHLIKELTSRNIPVLVFDIHRDYIAAFDNAYIITFDKKEKEFIEKLLEERGKKSRVFIGKFKLDIIKEYMEEILGISGKQAVHVFKLLSKLLLFKPKTINQLLNWLEGKDLEPGVRQVIEGTKEPAKESLKARIYRIKDWRLFRKNVEDEGENLEELIEKILNDIREGKGIFEEEFDIIGDEIIEKRIERRVNLIIVDLYPLSIEEQRILMDILLEKIYEIYKKWKFEMKTDILGIVIEEAHRFASKDIKASTKISLIAREGRKFGLGLILVSQIPSKILEDIISQINTFFLLKIINPKDLEFIRKTCPYLSREYFEALTKLETGKCLIVGLSVKNPAIIKVIKDVEVGGAEEDIEKRIIERVSKSL